MSTPASVPPEQGDPWSDTPGPVPGARESQMAAVLACDAPVALAADAQWREYWALRMDNPLADAETFKMDAHGRVLELGNKPPGYEDIEAQYMGLITIRADYLSAFQQVYASLAALPDTRTMYMTSLIQHLIDGDHLTKLHQMLDDLGCLDRHLVRQLVELGQILRQGGVAQGVVFEIDYTRILKRGQN